MAHMWGFPSPHVTTLSSFHVDSVALAIWLNELLALPLGQLAEADDVMHAIIIRAPHQHIHAVPAREQQDTLAASSSSRQRCVHCTSVAVQPLMPAYDRANTLSSHQHAAQRQMPTGYAQCILTAVRQFARAAPPVEFER
jgi:hypothetical protein